MSNEATLYSRATLKKLGVDWRVRLAKEVFLVKFIRLVYKHNVPTLFKLHGLQVSYVTNTFCFGSYFITLKLHDFSL